MFGFSKESTRTWLAVVVLLLIYLISFFTRLFSVIRFESIIHEFDPWFNFRSTKYLVQNGFYEFMNWFDESSWYPLGRVVGGTVYPGIMFTSATIYYVLNHIARIPVDIKDICVFLAPMFSGFTALAAFMFTKELKGVTSGLFAALFIGIAPGYISRSVAGSYDNEGIAIFLLMFTFYLWIKAVKTGSAFYGAMTAMFYYYMVSAWGGYVFITNLIPLHVFVLILMGRFSERIYISYSTFYVLGTLASMTIPFVGFQPTKTSEHMAALGVFGLIQLFAFANVIRSHTTDNQFKSFIRYGVATVVLLMFATLIGLTMTGVIAPFTGRFYSLWDTGYAKKYIPIIASVSEHQPTTWSSFFMDMNLALTLFPAGVFYCFSKRRDEHIFVILYSITASYFAGVMVRLILTLTPVVCVAAALAISNLLEKFSRETAESPKPQKKRFRNSESKTSPNAPAIHSYVSTVLVYLLSLYFLWFFIQHCTYITSSAYSSPSVILASRDQSGRQVIIDDFRDSYYWLRKNTPPDSRILSWWDYGYQIAGFSNRTTLVDNNTWNNTHIATVGLVLASNEETAYEVMRKHDVNYVLIIYGGLIGYSGDDINKFLWMVRIAQGIYPNLVKEKDFYNSAGEYSVGDSASKTMKESLMYKMSYYRLNEIQRGHAFDRVRNQKLPSKDPSLSVLEEVFSSKNLIVRIFKVKELDNIGRSLKAAAEFDRRNK
ncbi:STT3 subunit of Oligosaccharyl transferase [Rozella allomycis CSF55]|uniref:dolichyl-diphosphooligosaccharide--protein glycotransferase n=1 Tax=Rozella allomycis (strain CSF55) TaxID=988480 RepID=A0A075ARI0_ROZAC|nr:Oligosaccharyl transferase, STT3 subunit domain-containing protein [Rozella allomycis CSF55]RKP18145.1 STT3 subunit of Oligosaccharyl transferase [Rozella allomycis CSF55]|eukprot:EPZ32901.1 Oligosaccharyl transferase, STT3 subunit domain-containing protein [Rozella allomycis CSF55]